MAQNIGKKSACGPDLISKYRSSNNETTSSETPCTNAPWHIQDRPFHQSEDSDDASDFSSRRPLLSCPAGQAQHTYGSLKENAYSARAISSNSEPQTKEAKKSIEKYPFLMINVIVVLVNVGGRFSAPLMSQYLYQRYADGLFGNTSGKTSSHPCLNDSSINSTVARDIQKVQESTSETMLYLDLCNYCLGIPACLLLGALCNTMSRKQLLAVPLLGYLTKCVVIALVVSFDLNVNWLFLGYCAEGISGNVCGFFFGAFLYTSDITSRSKSRTMGVSILEGLKGLLSAGINAVTGQLIQRTGFVVPSMMTVGCVLLSMVCVFLLPTRDSRLEQGGPSNDGRPSLRWWTQLTTPFMGNQSSQTRQLIVLGGFAFLLSMISTVGVLKIETLYMMNIPFCFDAITVGWYMFGRDLAFNALLIGAVPLLYSRLPGMWLGILGCLSALAGDVLYATANTEIQIFLIIIVGVGQALPVSMVRGETSRLFGPEAQGPLFAVLAVLECVAYGSGTTALSVYRASLGVYRGLPFLLFAAVLVVVMILLSFYHVIWRRQRVQIN